MRPAEHVYHSIRELWLRLVVLADGALSVRGDRERVEGLSERLQEAIYEHLDELGQLAPREPATRRAGGPQAQLAWLDATPVNDNAVVARRTFEQRVSVADRSKRSASRGLGRDRVCCNCGKRVSPNGVRPDGWDFPLYRGELVGTCSPECRAAAGFPERKPGLVVRPFHSQGDASRRNTQNT